MASMMADSYESFNQWRAVDEVCLRLREIVFNPSYRPWKARFAPGRCNKGSVVSQSLQLQLLEDKGSDGRSRKSLM